MEENTRLGHRMRLRKKFFDEGKEALNKRDILEIYISLFVPQRDVKKLSYNILNHFESFEELLSASYDTLMNINGMTESAAASFLVLGELTKRAWTEPLYLDKPLKRLVYAHSVFEERNESDDMLGIFCMTTSFGMKKCEIIENFSFESTDTVSRIIRFCVGNKASTLFVARFSRHGNGRPTSNDIDLLSDIKVTLRDLNIETVDYLVLSKSGDTIMSQNEKLRQLFR